MEENDCVQAKDPVEFDEWCNKINAEFLKENGVDLDKTDIKRMMVRQFMGKFNVKIVNLV